MLVEREKECITYHPKGWFTLAFILLFVTLSGEHTIVLSRILQGCCGLFLTLSFITPLKTGHNQQRYQEKEPAESLVRNTEGFLLFEHNPDPVFSLSREAAMYSFALAPRKSIKPSWSSWERWSLSKSPSSREGALSYLCSSRIQGCVPIPHPTPACSDSLSSGWLRQEGLFSVPLSVHLVFLILLLFLLSAFP